MVGEVLCQASHLKRHWILSVEVKLINYSLFRGLMKDYSVVIGKN